MADESTRNLALICLDSVREDFFREYAPRLRSRADVVYTQCRAASGWSVPSHASMFTGRLPSEHGIHVYNRDFSDLRREDTFLGDLPHHAVGVSANAYANSAFGFDAMFDGYTDVSPHRRFPGGMDVMRFGQTHERSGLAKHVEFLRRALAHDHPVQSLANGAFVQVDDWFAGAPIPKPFDDGARIVLRAAREAVGRASEPFFLFTNFMDAHGPHRHVRGYDRSLHSASNTWSSGEYSSHEVNVADDLTPYEDDLRKTREVYGASIDYLDRKVDRFIEYLQGVTANETTVVITADHGENLGLDADRGLVAHKGALTEGLLHVPLAVVNAPAHGGRTAVDEYVSHLSLPELLTGLANDELPPITAEHPRAERIGSNLPNHVSRDSDEGRYWDRMIRVVYEDDHKRQWNSLGGQRSYLLDRDRPNWQESIDEMFDAEALDAEHFAVPMAEYKQRARGEAKADDIDEEIERRLEHLGYR